jgi:HlyD family secretion protein
MIKVNEAGETESVNSRQKKIPNQIDLNKKQTEIPSANGSEIEFENHNRGERKETFQKWLIRFAVLTVVILGVLLVFWYRQRPTAVTLIKPRQTTITETIVSSGRVGGVTETNVGAQSQGIVSRLYVQEGSSVYSGQSLALIKNDVAEAQVLQARAGVSMAQAQLVQASRGALSSDIDAAMEQVRQSLAQVEQQSAGVLQAEKNVSQARLQLSLFEAERDLAKKNLDRSASLVKDGVIPRAEYDQSLTGFQVAQKRVESQNESIKLAQSGVRSAQASLKSAQSYVKVQQAKLKTIQTGARSEDIRVAEERVAEAEKALRVAEQQAGNATVTAPFAGVVTKINSEVGQSVGSTGVLTLVSSEPEIRLDVDESNLSILRVGQETVISSSAFSDITFRGTVSELGASVDQTRGTIEVKIIPVNPPEWLRPGQTVNVNIITARNVNRLLIPQTALIRSGERTVVFVIEDGRAIEKPIVARQPTKDGVPIIAGLKSEESVVENAVTVQAGEKVRIKDN